MNPAIMEKLLAASMMRGYPGKRRPAVYGTVASYCLKPGMQEKLLAFRDLDGIELELVASLIPKVAWTVLALVRSE